MGKKINIQIAGIKIMPGTEIDTNNKDVFVEISVKFMMSAKEYVKYHRKELNISELNVMIENRE